jgi:uncharacterized protein (TIGR03437 family)
VKVDAAGNVYIADAGNARIRKVGLDGTITTVAGNGNAGFSGAGQATSAAIGNPQDLALDSAGNLFIASNANVILKVTPSGAITNVAGNGNLGYSGDGGPATSAALNQPREPVIDSAGNLYIADLGNNRVRKVSNGVITTAVGTGVAGFAGDGGPGGSAELFSPTGVSLDAAGNLYIADRDNNRIRVVQTNGIISTVAGNGAAGYSGDAGPAISASLNGPKTMSILGTAIYIADSGNNRIRLLTPANPAPSITTGGVVPIYSSSNTIQPGSWVSIYGNNLATGTSTWNGNFPLSLGGASVTINGKSAYLWFVSPTQINLQAPDDTATGAVNVVVTTQTGTATSTVTLAQFGPSFSVLGDGKHAAGIILRTDGSGAYGGGTYDIVGPTGTSLGYQTVAAKAGDTLILFGVGFGPTSPTVPAGAAYSGSAPTTYLVQLLINNLPVAPTFSGITSAGLYQMNVVGVPTGLGVGDVPLVGIVGGVKTPLGVVLSLQ